jgi:hypothetical protein
VPGKITDQLRQITREQGGAGEEPPPAVGRTAEPRAKRYGPLVALAMVILLAGGGWILVQKMMEMSRIQDCAMSGRKNCAPIDTSAP